MLFTSCPPPEISLPCACKPCLERWPKYRISVQHVACFHMDLYLHVRLFIFTSNYTSLTITFAFHGFTDTQPFRGSPCPLAAFLGPVIPPLIGHRFKKNRMSRQDLSLSVSLRKGVGLSLVSDSESGLVPRREIFYASMEGVSALYLQNGDSMNVKFEVASVQVDNHIRFGGRVWVGLSLACLTGSPRGSSKPLLRSAVECTRPAPLRCRLLRALCCRPHLCSSPYADAMSDRAPRVDASHLGRMPAQTQVLAVPSGPRTPRHGGARRERLP